MWLETKLIDPNPQKHHIKLLQKREASLTTIFRVILALMVQYTTNSYVALSQRLIKILYQIHIALQKKQNQAIWQDVFFTIYRNVIYSCLSTNFLA